MIRSSRTAISVGKYRPVALRIKLILNSLLRMIGLLEIGPVRQVLPGLRTVVINKFLNSNNPD